ncbi:MAG: PIN domain-containing protein [Raoultibacter sp.]
MMPRMQIFIDSNVFLDYLMQRQPFYHFSRQVFLLGVYKEADLWLSSSMVTDVFYLLRKAFGWLAAEEMIENSLEFVRVCSVGEEEVKSALRARQSDFEDCLVAKCAERQRADYFITRDDKGFKNLHLPVFSPEEFMTHLKQQKGFAYDEIDFSE